MKAMVVVGTRPEAVKLAPLILALKRTSSAIVVTTGQHAEMAARTLADFGILPDLSMPTLPAARSLGLLASLLIDRFGALIAEHQPDWMVVQGDTSSAFAAGLAAFYGGLPVAHVEAGLRTGDLASPFPEEGHRQLLARIARLSFAPTELAAANLAGEGIAADRIRVVGNTVVDAVNLARAGWTAERRAAIERQLALPDTPLVLVTCHRRENLGPVLADICAALAALARRYPGHLWLFPVHPNPEVRALVAEALGALPNVRLSEPLDYHQTLFVLSRAELVVTDSGGLQEEAPSFARPVAILRDRTERPEAIAAGFATLAGRGPAEIERTVADWLDHPARRHALAGQPNPFGDGKAAERISAELHAASRVHK